jgi:hypothetical protein
VQRFFLVLRASPAVFSTKSNYFVPMPWNIACERILHFATVFKG